LRLFAAIPHSAIFTLITLIRFDPDPEYPLSNMKSLRAFVPLREPNPSGFTLIALIRFD
jgi:hypothetical protein